MNCFSKECAPSYEALFNYSAGLLLHDRRMQNEDMEDSTVLHATAPAICSFLYGVTHDCPVRAKTDSILEAVVQIPHSTCIGLDVCYWDRVSML